MTSIDFAHRVRSGDQIVGYWVVMDCPVATERIALTGYDYVCFDGQHGLLSEAGIRQGLMAVDAAQGPAGLVRVVDNSVASIGKALDAGAQGVIVPLVSTPEDAAAAVAACRYPPHGVRSYGPMRSGLRIGPDPAVANDSVLCLVMIETPEGLERVEQICAVPGVDGVYIGPSDLTLAIGGARPGDPDVQAEFDAAVARVRKAAQAAGVTAGIHTASGAIAQQRLAEGFTFVTVASDVVHLQQAAAAHLAEARGSTS